MLRLYECVAEQHDLRFVALAAAICLLSSFTGFGLAMRANAAPAAWLYRIWIAGAAVVIGAGTWATHFVAMLAYEAGVPVGYDVGLTALSVVLAIGIAGLGFTILAAGLPILGGAVVGLAVATMHFVGIAAVRLPAAVVWDWTYIIVAVAVAVGGGAAAFAVGSLRRRRGLRMTAPVILVIAIVGLHFTAMAGWRLVPDPTIVPLDAVEAPSAIAIAIAAISGLVLGLGLVGSMVDQHLAQRRSGEAKRLRAHVLELETTKMELEQRSAEVSAALEAVAASSQAKSQFLANMSHELRTPLNAIIGYSSMQVGEVLGPIGNPTYREYSQDILNAGQHLLALINDILDISRLDTASLSLEEEEIDVAGLVDEVARLVAPQCEAAGLTLHQEAAENLPSVQGDHRRLRQVLLNLAANAIKFTPAPGEVRIGACETAEGGIAMSVSDTGIGIAADRVAVALERFGQVENGLTRKYDGAGLGLPLSRQLIELHGGQLALESEVGVGTTVTATLPATRVASRADAA